MTVEQLRQRHEVLLLDAYGVLLHHAGPMPHAPELIHHLNASRAPYFILTNDASRSPATCAARYGTMGLPIPRERIITSGSLLAGHFVQRQLQGASCVVLGPDDSADYVRAAGGVVVPPTDKEASVLVICDELGFSFVETIDSVLTLLFHRLDASRPMELVLPNPDLVYPKQAHGYGFTAGSIATLIEAALAQRYATPHRFVRLGKPNGPIFVEAARRAGTRDMVMVGDQLATDIRGALDFGIPAALIETGLDRYRADMLVHPTYLLAGLGL